MISYLQISETAEDDGGVTSRLGQAHRTGGDLSVDRLMYEAICVVGKSLSSDNNNNNNNNNNCPELVKTPKNCNTGIVEQNLALTRLT